jgi:lycopene cyclase domain-containing protein
VQKYGYMAMIIFTIIGSFWLEVILKVGVLKQIKRTSLSIAPVAILFIAWDKYAISHGHWLFDKDQILGIYGPWCIPLEEYLFFIVVPIAALMTIEAVRTTKKNWRV